MRTAILILAMIVLCVAGCQRGDFKTTVVAEGQDAPHAGYNIGPETWVEEGDICKVGGVVIWIKGVEPNDITGD